MEIRKVEKQSTEWNRLAKHPLQTWEWGEFREKTGVKVVRAGGIQATIHPIPHTPWTIGYVPKGPAPDPAQVKTLAKIASEHNCIYIKCEPLAEVGKSNIVISNIKKARFVRGRSLFTPHNFVLDLTPSEQDLLKQMKPKTRYNIRLAERKGVEVEVDNSEEAFERYLELTRETTKRQKFYSHSQDYHRKMWQELHKAGMAEILVAKYKKEIITTWVLFTHNDTLYYPYGASTREHRELMANNLVMWEAIRLGKKRGLKYLDMWGALGPKPDKNDPWYGFHKFKEGYGGRHVTYIGSWDYVACPLLYYPLRLAEWTRWKVLRIMK